MEDREKSSAFLSFEENADGGLIAKYNQHGIWGEKAPDHFYIPETHDGKAVETLDLSWFLPEDMVYLFLPKSLKEIRFNQYEFAPALEKIEIDPENNSYWTDGVGLYTKDRTKFLRLLNLHLEEYAVAEGTRILGNQAFANCWVLRKVVLPDTVQELEERAFAAGYKEGIEPVDREVIGIEHVHFEDVSAVWQTTYFRDNPNTISGKTYVACRAFGGSKFVVPEGVEVIGRGCFQRNRGADQEELEEIVLPDTVRTIKDYAFSGNKKLQTVKLSENLENIPDGAFDQCESLETLYIPASVTDFSLLSLPESNKSLNSNPSQFREIVVADNNPCYCSLDGILFSKDKKTLFFAPRNLTLSSYAVPDGVEHIMDYAFANNRGLKEIQIPDSVQTIGEYAFAHCKELQSVQLSQICEIGTGAFSECVDLSIVVFPQSLVKIGESAFSGCRKLVSISLRSGLETIGKAAFENCGLSSVVIPKTVKRIFREAFTGCKSITVYDTIDPDAGECHAAIDMWNAKPNSEVGAIGVDFWKMNRRMNREWANHRIIVKSAETDSVKYVVNMESDAEQRQYYSMLISGWGHHATFAFSALDEFFPKIAGGEYKLRVALSRLKYPVELSDEKKEAYTKYITRVAKDAVKECITSDDMELLELLKDIGAIKPQHLEELIDFANQKLKTEFVAWLMNYQHANPAKAKKKKDELTLDAESKPKKTKPVDKTSDAYMKKVWGVSTDYRGRNLITSYKGEDTEIVFPTEVAGKKISGIASRRGVPAIYPSLTSVVIPEGYEEIGGSAFAGCKALKRVILPNSVESIGDQAFMECASLETIILPTKLWNLGKWAFRDCCALKDVYVLNPYMNIEGKAVFRGCGSYVVHAPAGAAIGMSVKGKHFAVLSANDNRGFAKAFFPEPVKEMVFLNEPLDEESIARIKANLPEGADDFLQGLIASQGDGYIPQIGDEVYFDGASVLVQGHGPVGSVTKLATEISQVAPFLEGTVISEVRDWNAKGEEPAKCFDVEVWLKKE